jgi:hypothetical protein
LGALVNREKPSGKRRLFRPPLLQLRVSSCRMLQLFAFARLFSAFSHRGATEMTRDSTGFLPAILVSAAALGLCFPQGLLAAGVAGPRAPAMIDVALTDGGVLVGQVVDPQGAALRKAPVSLFQRDREIARTLTDHQGYFAVRGLRGGVYQIAAAQGHGIFRVWTPGTAPPSCQQGALLIAGDPTFRGQCSGPCGGPSAGPMGYWLSSPCVVGAIIGAAVAVPMAIHNSQRPTSP